MGQTLDGTYSGGTEGPAIAVALRNRRKSFYYSLFFILLLAYGPLAGIAEFRFIISSPSF